MVKRLLVFPVAWFGGLVLIDWGFNLIGAQKESLAEFASIFIEYGLGVVWGVICYLAQGFLLRSPAPKVRGPLWPLTLVGAIVLIFLGPLMSGGSVDGFGYDPIGAANDVGNPPCAPTNYSGQPNGNGLFATVREVHCLGDWDEPSTYFVFVRRVDGPNSRDNLVLRYRGGWDSDHWGRPAGLIWRSPKRLVITVDGPIEQITEERYEASGVQIEYAIPKPECPTISNSWERLLWRWERLLVWC